ncbi:putative Feruloyl esterase b [Lipomyces starkeyi]
MGPHTPRSFEQQCLSLPKSLNIPGANTSSSEFIAANTTVRFPDANSTCRPSSQKVSVRNQTGGMAARELSGRFLSTGNGGLGCIGYEDIEYAASLGFAAIGTNNGHDGTTGQSFLDNPDVIEDFAYRALPRSFTASRTQKATISAARLVGRQGFKEVESFPEDFDAVVAGAPAFSFNNLTSWSCHFLPLTGPVDADTFIPMDMWSAIHQDILNQCDVLDGMNQRVPYGTTDSNAPRSLLALAQRRRQSGVSSQQPGAELTGAPQTYFTGQPFGAVDWWRYAIFNDSAWNPFTLKPGDYVTSSNLNLFDIETWNGDLSALQKRGGKVLHYHGLADGVIFSENSPRYYEHVSQTMCLLPTELDDFYRYFRISVAHCGGGPSAVFIGNSARNTASRDPNENVLMAIVRWVEEGVAPDTILGTAYVNGTKLRESTSSAGIVDGPIATCIRALAV